MKINYCLPIIKNNKKKVLEIVNQNVPYYSYFEIWLDYLQDLDTEFIDLLCSLYEEKLVFLFRRQNLEEIKMPKDAREKIIWQIANTKSLLDLDISQKSELDYIKDKNLKPNLILSLHDYKKTPSFPEMIDTISDMEKHHPEIIKFSTFCNSEQDCVKLLNLLMHLKQEKKKFIVMGMGEEGVIARVAGAIWGNEMNYAPISLEEKSAPGQLTKVDLEKVLEIITK